MKKTRFTDEQLVTILREADEKSVPEVAKKHGVSAQTIYAWRKHFGSLEPSDVKRLRQLEQENGRLKKMVADRRACALLSIARSTIGYVSRLVARDRCRPPRSITCGRTTSCSTRAPMAARCSA
jgi:putative transposase